jgi:putative PIN family toxin of toxin-antitoxin system
MRVVLDTNVLVRAAARQDGLAGKLLQQIVEGPHVLVCSLHILAEVSRVLRYPRLQARWPLGPQQIGEFITRVAAVAEVVSLSARPAEPVAADPDDDPILETAVSGRADVLCTLDQHL